jgi:hypothetical protein
MNVSSHAWKIDPNINLNIKINMIIYKLSCGTYLLHSGITLWNSGKERKERELLSITNIP